MALRCQGIVLMLADTTGNEYQPSPPAKKGMLSSLFTKTKVEIRALWISRKLVLTDESLRYFRPKELKFDINDPTPYGLQNASDKLLTRVSTQSTYRLDIHAILNSFITRISPMWSFEVLIK
jgi:hypothetical protein